MAADKGMLRSCYGLQKYSPEEIKEQWREFMRKEIVLKNNAFYKVHVPVDRSKTLKSSNNITYFNNDKWHSNKSTYDRMFHIEHGYCSSIHRDDRKHTQGLDVHAEEESKAIPLLSSSVYGHRPPLEVPSRQYVRVGLVKRDFYRHCGSTIPCEESVQVQAKK